MIGQTISHYKILEKLGEGGMGIVYKAHDTRLDRIVALKFLPHHLTANDAEKARFLQEARAAATLNHPHVCTIYRIDEHEGQQFIEMEYVAGETLRKKIPISKVDDALLYAAQIGEALQEAHGKGIVHRDIKCDNIMVNDRNQIKVMDFGLAKLKGSLKLTRTSSTVGTLSYMAPEQIQGGDVDHRSDIFSFGVVIFEMLTGKMPFRGEHEAAVMYSIMNEEPESLVKHRPDLSPEIDRIIRRALEKDPEDRYQSTADMMSEVRREAKKSGRVTRPIAALNSDPTPPSRSISSPKEPRKRNVLAILIGILGLTGAVAGGLYLFNDRQESIDSLAVLPFENVGGGQELEYLSDGVTESIINNLTKIQGLRVAPRSSAFRFKGKEIDLQETGSKLKVSAILTGKVVHHGQSLDVQVDLIDVKNESQIWGNRYQSDLSRVLTLQYDITREVASKLGFGLTSETRASITKRYTDNTAAYQLYLQGRYYWNKRNAVSIDRSIEYFKQAIALDSTYALAYSGLADSYIIQPQYAGAPMNVVIPRTQAAARRALELDNSLAEAHTAMAFSYFFEWKYEEAEREFKEAISLNPRYPTAYHWYNIMLLRTGKTDEAEPIIRKASDLDPFSPVIVLNVGIIDLLHGRYDEALRYFNKGLELDPTFAPAHGWIGKTYERMKKYQEALPNLEKAVELSGRSAENLSNLGHYYGVVGKKEEALRLVQETEARYRQGKGAAYSVARIYAGLGDEAQALAWLERDCEEKSTWTTELLIDYVWDDLREDQRFVALLKKVGLKK